MKRMLLALLLFLAAKAGAQPWDKTSVEKLLCRVWNLDYVTLDGEETEEEGGAEKLMFKADHTALAPPHEAPAKWSYHEASHEIRFEIPEEEVDFVMKIVELSETKLIVEVEGEEGTMQAHYIASKE